MKCVGALCVLLLCGCAPAVPDPPPPLDEAVLANVRDAASRKRVRPLDAYCGDAQCPSYTVSAAKAAAEAQRAPQPWRRCLRAAVGTCGDLRFTSVSTALVGWTEYFNPTGTLVAAHIFSDVGSSYFGTVLSCVEVVVTDHCKATWPR